MNISIGDKCWISNEGGYDLQGCDDLLGPNTTSQVVALFVTSEGVKMATVEHPIEGCHCWRLDMLRKPAANCDFEVGDNVYVEGGPTGRIYVGEFVGINPAYGEIVTLLDGRYETMCGDGVFK